MHMVIVYYVFCAGLTLLFSLWYMNKFWTEELFNEIKKEKGGEIS